jgi:hypothetical protein
MTALPDWPYGQLFDPSSHGKFPSKSPKGRAKLIRLARREIALRRLAIRADQRARVLAIWLSWSLALLMIAAAIVAIYLGRETAAVASVLGAIPSVCWGILTSWRQSPPKS